MTKMRRTALGILALAGALALPVAPAMAGDHGDHSGRGGHHARYTCTGGEIPSGKYWSITVTGQCAVAANAVIEVVNDVTVAKGAALDAQSAPSTITVGDDVTAGPGSLLGLGCQPAALVGNTAHPCTTDPEGHSTITVKGSVTALKASTVLLNGITVRGSVTVLGGGGEIPWSIKNNTVGRNITVSGQTTNWLGVMFNQVAGSVTLLFINITDNHPDANPAVYIVRNQVGRNLVCFGLTPGVSGGFVPGSVNVVGGKALGQCAALV